MLSGFMSMTSMTYGADDPEGNPDDGDVVVAAGMPIFMLEEAVESMKHIKEIGAKAKKEKQKELILKVLTIVLLVIPFVGEAAAPLIGGGAMVARIATLIGEAGNAALGIQQLVDDPLSAPFVILGILAGGPGALEGRAESKGFGKAATARQLMKDEQLSKFPHTFRDKDALVQKLVYTCHKPKTKYLLGR